MTFHHTAPEYVTPHTCRPPGGSDAIVASTLSFGYGTIWQCTECQTYWELRWAPYYSAAYHQWHVLSKFSAHRRLRKLKRRERRKQARTVKPEESSS